MASEIVVELPSRASGLFQQYKVCALRVLLDNIPANKQQQIATETRARHLSDTTRSHPHTTTIMRAFAPLALAVTLLAGNVAAEEIILGNNGVDHREYKSPPRSP